MFARMDQGPFLFFDGKCHFCIAIVGFVLKRDKGLYRVLPVQHIETRKILRALGVSFVDLNTIYVVEEGKIYTRSRAAFKIFSHLPFPWNVFSWFKGFPVKWTDAMYKWVARNRFVFGRSDTRLEWLAEKFGSRFLTL